MAAIASSVSCAMPVDIPAMLGNDRILRIEVTRASHLLVS
jgi:hypothetical protein